MAIPIYSIILWLYFKIVQGSFEVNTETFTGQHPLVDCPIPETFTLPTWTGPPVDGTGSLTVYTSNGSSQINTDLPHKDRVRYASNQRSLVINNVQVNDSGVYTCSITLDGVTYEGHNNVTVKQNTVRLVNGSALSNGRVEVLHNGEWGTICHNGWDDREAEVVCKQLGFGGKFAISRSYFGQGTGPIWMSDVNCRGWKERELFECNSLIGEGIICDHSQDASVVCSSIPDTNVVVTGPFVGQHPLIDCPIPETFTLPTWTGPPVDGTGSLTVYTSNGSSQINTDLHHKDRVRYASNQRSLVINNVQANESGVYTCSITIDGVTYEGHNTLFVQRNTVRLVNGSALSNGRVEVLHNGEWGTICNNGWDDREAEVVCKQLGFGGKFAISMSYFGQGTGPIWMSDVHCDGWKERELFECYSLIGEGIRCDHSQEASVVCSSIPDKNVVVTGPSVGQHPLIDCPIPETFTLPTWTGPPVDGTGSLTVYTSNGSSQINTDLHHKDRVWYASNQRSLAINNVQASDAGVYTCSITLDGVTYEGHNTLFVKRNRIRLVNGSKPSEGRLEVQVGGDWGTVCDYFWDQQDAKVVCRQLGFGGGMAIPRAYFGEGSGDVKVHSFDCHGHELDLFDCGASWTTNTCHHSEVASVVCSEMSAVCPAGSYGIGCHSNCSHCKNNDVCNNTNGHCPAGCDAGYFGDKCDSAGNLTMVALYHDPIDAISGTRIEIVCQVASVPSSSECVFQWLFNGVVFHPSAKSRFSISSSTDETSPESKHSLLTIDPILMEYAGIYTCSASSGPVKASKSLDVKVVSSPHVLISPRSKTVMAGDTIKIECSLNTTEVNFYNFTWYRNGRILMRDHGENIVYHETSQVLTISGIGTTTEFGCEGVNKWGTGKRVYSYIGVIQTQAQSGPNACSAETDGGRSWPLTAVDSYSILDCDPGHTGQIIRFCKPNGEFAVPIYNCLKTVIAEIKNKLDELQDGIKKGNISDIVNELAKETGDVDLHQTDMEVILDAMDIVSDTTDTKQAVNTETGETESENVLQIASNMINQQNRVTWVNRIEQGKPGAIDVPVVLEKYIMKKTGDIMTNATTTYFVNFDVPNIYAEVGRNTKTSYNLPIKSSKSPTWMIASGTKVHIDAASLSGVQSDYITLSSAFYRNVTDMLAKALKRNGHTENFTDTMDVNADMVSVQIKEITTTFSPPVRIHFQHFSSNYSNPVCAYWSITEQSFLTDGCSLESTSDYITVCACNHFTNFAVLMSPGKTPSSDVIALSVISAVGCAISIFCMLITVGTHVLVWRMIKNDRVVMLLNLCIALIVSYVVFLAGIRQTGKKVVCTVVSVLLHYMYLAVFCLMLGYGVEVAISVLYVFRMRSRLKLLLALAWGVPAVVVAISVGTTKAEGYGSKDFCWLSVASDLLWAFVAPAVVVIAINTGIVIAVLVKMFRTRAMMQKSETEKVKVAARSLVVLLPIFGLTWVFGVFSVNERLVAFQYIFAICNSLQGFFIFLFHCLLNPQLTNALKKRRERKRSLASLESDFKHKQYDGNVSTLDTKSESKDNNGLFGRINATFEGTEQTRSFVNINSINAGLNDDVKDGANVHEQAGGTSNNMRNTTRNSGASATSDNSTEGLHYDTIGSHTESLASGNRPGDHSPSVFKSDEENQRISHR